MKIKLIAVGKQGGSWHEAAFETYTKRLPSHFNFQLIEISPVKTSKQQTKLREGEKILAHVDARDKVIALDQQGELINTQQLATKLAGWQIQGGSLCFLIGGADGLSDACKQRASWLTSLSLLTFPHKLVRIILIEQLYRAHSILTNHPYHRE